MGLGLCFHRDTLHSKKGLPSHPVRLVHRSRVVVHPPVGLLQLSLCGWSRCRHPVQTRVPRYQYQSHYCHLQQYWIGQGIQL